MFLSAAKKKTQGGWANIRSNNFFIPTSICLVGQIYFPPKIEHQAVENYPNFGNFLIVVELIFGSHLPVNKLHNNKKIVKLGGPGEICKSFSNFHACIKSKLTYQILNDTVGTQTVWPCLTHPLFHLVSRRSEQQASSSHLSSQIQSQVPCHCHITDWSLSFCPPLFLKPIWGWMVRRISEAILSDLFCFLQKYWVLDSNFKLLKFHRWVFMERFRLSHSLRLARTCAKQRVTTPNADTYRWANNLSGFKCAGQSLICHIYATFYFNL